MVTVAHSVCDVLAIQRGALILDIIQVAKLDAGISRAWTPHPQWSLTTALCRLGALSRKAVGRGHRQSPRLTIDRWRAADSRASRSSRTMPSTGASARMVFPLARVPTLNLVTVNICLRSKFKSV